jgi:hypothetical protein
MVSLDIRALITSFREERKTASTSPLRGSIAGAILLLVAGGAAAAGCGAGAGPAEQSPGARCGRDMAWGGWNGTVECARIARTPIPAADLGCDRDADCVIVARSRCGANAVAAHARGRYAGHPPACGHPAAGACPPLDFVGTCRNGCCSVGIADDVR